MLGLLACSEVYEFYSSALGVLVQVLYCSKGGWVPFLKEPTASLFCSAVWCSAAETHLKLLDSAVSAKLKFPRALSVATKWALSGSRWYYTDESPGLPMAFRQDIPPYPLEIHQWRPDDNDPCSTSEKQFLLRLKMAGETMQREYEKLKNNCPNFDFCLESLTIS